MSTSSLTTKEIEHIAYKHLWKKGKFLIFEVGVPKTRKRQTSHRERVDLLSYETSGIWRCYEIKRNLQDWKSGAALSWYGHFNYLICPPDLYEKIKHEIPDDIGVWLVYKTGKNKGYMDCVKKPKRREPLYSSAELMLSLIQALSREYKKYRKILEKQK